MSDDDKVPPSLLGTVEPNYVGIDHPFFTIHLHGDGSKDDAERIANTALMQATKESTGTGWTVAYMTGAMPDES